MAFVPSPARALDMWAINDHKKLVRYQTWDKILTHQNTKVDWIEKGIERGPSFDELRAAKYARDDKHLPAILREEADKRKRAVLIFQNTVQKALLRRKNDLINDLIIDRKKRLKAAESKADAFKSKANAFEGVVTAQDKLIQDLTLQVAANHYENLTAQMAAFQQGDQDGDALSVGDISNRYMKLDADIATAAQLVGFNAGGLCCTHSQTVHDRLRYLRMRAALDESHRLATRVKHGLSRPTSMIDDTDVTLAQRAFGHIQAALASGSVTGCGDCQLKLNNEQSTIAQHIKDIQDVRARLLAQQKHEAAWKQLRGDCEKANEIMSTVCNKFDNDLMGELSEMQNFLRQGQDIARRIKQGLQAVPRDLQLRKLVDEQIRLKSLEKWNKDFGALVQEKQDCLQSMHDAREKSVINDDYLALDTVTEVVRDIMIPITKSIKSLTTELCANSANFATVHTQLTTRRKAIQGACSHAEGLLKKTQDGSEVKSLTWAISELQGLERAIDTLTDQAHNLEQIHKREEEVINPQQLEKNHRRLKLTMHKLHNYAVVNNDNIPVKEMTFVIEDPNFRLRDKLQNIGDAYSRISTHFKEEKRKHYGIDIPEVLPDKGHILFGERDDLDEKNHTFIKPEEHGVKTWKDFCLHAKGLFDSLFTKFCNRGMDDQINYRKERVPDAAIKAFRKIVNNDYEAMHQAERLGIRYMYENGGKSNQEFRKVISRLDYWGKRKGREIYVPKEVMERIYMEVDEELDEE